MTTALGALDPGTLLLADGGLETVLVFGDGRDLPSFAAFPLLATEEGRDRLRRYYRDFLDLARDSGAGFVLETPTWRANPAWAPGLGVSRDDLRRVSDDAVALGRGLADGFDGGPFLLSGCAGPRDDGFDAARAMTAGQAADHHGEQVGDLAAAGVDLVTAMTLAYPAEAVGFVEAADRAGVPAVVSFTVEPDGRLPDGTPLGEAVEAVDAATGAAAAWFGVNCAHPDHLRPALDWSGPPPGWASRVKALRPNGSRLTHAELDVAQALGPDDPDELGALTRALADRLGAVRVLGGCCGTDVRHVRAIAGAAARPAAGRPVSG